MTNCPENSSDASARLKHLLIANPAVWQHDRILKNDSNFVAKLRLIFS
jgi:hypothetical protein